jgi:transcriptional regulator with XRE-family HTH domain
MLISGPKLVVAFTAACKAKRQALGLRQRDLAARCGVTGATIVRFERTGHVRLDVFARIVVALDLGEIMHNAITTGSAPVTRPRSGEEFLRGTRSTRRIRVKKINV